MNREFWLSQVRENVKLLKRKREVEAYGEPNESRNRKEKLAQLSRGLETRYRDALEEAQNSSVTIEELSYYKFLLKFPCPAKHRKHPWIRRRNPLNLKIPCMIGHIFREHTYIDLRAPVNVMSRRYYNMIMSTKIEPRRDFYNPNRLCNFVGRVKGVQVFVKNFTYICDFMILEDMSGIIDQDLGDVVLGNPFVNTSKMIYNKDEGAVSFSGWAGYAKYVMPHKCKKFEGIEHLDVDNTPALDISKDNLGEGRIKYSGCMALGPEYEWDNDMVEYYKAAHRMRYGKT